MRGEQEHSFPSVEKEPELDEATKRNHLDYIERLGKSTLNYLEESAIRLKCPPDLERLQRLREFIGKWNERADEQLKTGRSGAELSFNLSRPPQEKVEPELQKKAEAKAQLELFTAWSENEELGKELEKELGKKSGKDIQEFIKEKNLFSRVWLIFWGEQKKRKKNPNQNKCKK